jgi:hypothetical protein
METAIAQGTLAVCQGIIAGEKEKGRGQKRALACVACAPEIVVCVRHTIPNLMKIGENTRF